MVLFSSLECPVVWKFVWSPYVILGIGSGAPRNCVWSAYVVLGLDSGAPCVGNQIPPPPVEAKGQ